MAVKHYPNGEMDYQLYVLAELRYNKACDEREIEEDDRFPVNWYGSKDYHFKVEIIARALKHHVTIGELPALAAEEGADEDLRRLSEELVRVFGA